MKTQAPTATERHYTIKGRKFVRVTELLRAVGASNFDEIPERDRQFYMDRGTANHDLWQKVEEGVDGQYTFDPRVEAYRAAHARFLRETNYHSVPGGIEKRVHATWEDLGLSESDGEFAGVAGRLDRFGLIQDRHVLIDYKTSSVPKSTALQTAIYLLCLPYKFTEVERYGVAFRADGTYQMSVRYPFSDKQEAMFLLDKFRKENNHDAAYR